MKQCQTTQSSRHRAVALITTLILVSAIALVTISVLTISQNEAQISGSRLGNTRADLAERAAFEEAKNILQALTDNDDYIVTSVMEEQGSPGQAGMRYTFISTLKRGSVSHAPLFAGGDSQSLFLPNLDETETAALADAPIGRPEVDISANERTKVIEGFGLTHLSERGDMIPEDRFPETGLIEMESDLSDKFKLRYTWWAEDLEGYPNIDVVGGWTDYYENNEGVSIDFIRPGYAATDSRTIPVNSGDPAGLRIPDPADPYFAWQFPKSFRGQRFTGQVAPGLSPREIILQPWATPGIPLRAHPFAGGNDLSTARHWLSSGGAYTRTSMVKREHRFMVGLHSYLNVPRIPYNHGYADEGQPRHNLNVIVSNRLVSSNQGTGGFLQIVERNLPEFEQRRGGFPTTTLPSTSYPYTDDDNYLATIGASVIDYSDTDSFPTAPENSENIGNHQYRGVDNYCPINEFFVRFVYDEVTREEGDYIFKFSAELFAEFWNTTNQPARMEAMLLEFEFLDDLGFKYSAFKNEYRRISEEDLEEDEENENPLTVPSGTPLIQPNQYYVHYFGKRQWSVRVPSEDIPPFERPTVQSLQAYAADKSSVRVTYRLRLHDQVGNRVLVDSSGRPDPQPPGTPDPLAEPPVPLYGFFFNKHNGVLNSGDSFMRVAAGNLGMARTGGFASKLSGSHLGDPWMTFYARSTVDNSQNRGAEYRNRASPGFRNYDFSKVNSSSRSNVIKDQTRVRDWPDRGYDNEHPGNQPSDENELPTSLNPRPNAPERFDRARAPFRISNEGVYFSVTELGNIHDPVMWSSVPLELVEKSSLNFKYDRFSNPLSYFHDLPVDFTGSMQNAAKAARHQLWGGGNTLRIGRPEHPLFDQPGQRASQLLDLFQVGNPGTNLRASTESIDLYDSYDPRDHQPPPAAANAIEAQSPPFNRIYDERLHAQSLFQQRHGHLNINSVPTVFEIETLLRGPFASSGILVAQDNHSTPDYISVLAATSDTSMDPLSNALRAEAIPLVARGLYEARPFYSPSHLARVLSELLRRHKALPDHHNDAEAEETFARMFNTTSFKSRHFRIFTYGEVLPRNSEVVLSRNRKIYEVFMEPQHDDSGNITRITTRILSIRDL